MDPWALLPTDLLLVIFLSLEPTAVIRCSGVCKTWRRAIIGNASMLGPHLDSFGRPSLLLGVFHNCRTAACLRRMPGPFQSALTWNDGGDNETAAAHSLIPASSASSSGVGRGFYKELLCSKDGFILLMARSGRDRSLCLCNPMTGDCTFLPSAARGRYSSYFLLTSYDHDDLSPSCTANKLAARILTVHTRTRYNDLQSVFKFKAQVLSYQIFSTSGDNAGKWGSVKRSVGEFKEGLCVRMDHWSTVVCGDTVYWIAGPEGYITCALALDMTIGKTWTTELPKQCHFRICSRVLAILTTSSNSGLSLMMTFPGEPGIQVWVLTSDVGWTLQQTISIGRKCLISGSLIPEFMYFCALCPRSRCVVAKSSESDQQLLIDLGNDSSCAPVTCIGNCQGFDCFPFEIDCSSTFISRMKHF